MWPAPVAYTAQPERHGSWGTSDPTEYGWEGEQGCETAGTGREDSAATPNIYSVPGEVQQFLLPATNDLPPSASNLLSTFPFETGHDGESSPHFLQIRHDRFTPLCHPRGNSIRNISCLQEEMQQIRQNKGKLTVPDYGEDWTNAAKPAEMEEPPECGGSVQSSLANGQFFFLPPDSVSSMVIFSSIFMTVMVDSILSRPMGTSLAVQVLASPSISMPLALAFTL